MELNRGSNYSHSPEKERHSRRQCEEAPLEQPISNGETEQRRKKRRLPASELLQNAVRAELRRRELLAEADKYVDELSAEVGVPTERQRLRARAITGEIVARKRRKAG